MKLWFALFLACATLAPAEPARAEGIPEALDEAERFATAGKWREALEAGNRLRTLCLEQNGGENPNMALAELFLGEVRDHLGDRTLAESHFRRALAIQEKALPPDAPELVATLTRLGGILKEQQRFDEAAGLLQRAFDLQLKRRGAEDADTAVVGRNLARVLRSKREYKEAAALLEQALAVQRRLAGGHDPETLEGLHELAQTHELAGDDAAAELDSAERVIGAAAEYGEQSAELVAALFEWARYAEKQPHFADAEPRYRRALGIVEKSFATDETMLTMALTQLGWCLRNLSRFDEARPLLQRALDVRIHLSGPNHLETAASSRLLGWVCLLERDFASARPLFEKTRDIREAKLGPSDPLTLESLGELGDLEWRSGDFDEAASLLEKHRYRVEQATGATSEATATAWHGLAIVYESAKRWAEATDAALRSLRLHEQRFGAGDTRTLGEMVLLSRICEAAGEFGPALTQYARLAAWYGKHPEAGGQGHAELLRQYAVSTLKANKPDAAGPLFRESLRVHESTFGPRDPATLRSIADLWTYYDTVRQPALALENARELAARTESAFGPDAPATSAIFDRLGQLCLTLGDRAEALKWFRRSLDGRRRHFGPGSDDALDALGQVAVWFEQAHDFTAAANLRSERLSAVRGRYGPDAEPTSTACGELAMSYFRAGDLPAARGMFDHQIELIEKRTGAGSVESLGAVAHLGDVAVAAHDLPAAIKARERLAAGCQQHFGEQHREYGRALLLLGEALLASGDAGRAENVLRTAQPLVSQRDPVPDAAATRIACALARASLKLGKREEAERRTRKALTGPFAPEEALAEAFSQLGAEWSKAGSGVFGEDTFEVALKIQAQATGDQDDHTLALLQNLAQLRLRFDRPGATDLLERALAGSEAIYGPETPATATALGWLTLARVKERQFREAQTSARRLLEIVKNAPAAPAPPIELARQMEAWTGLLAGPVNERQGALARLNDALLESGDWIPLLGTAINTAAADALEAVGDPRRPAL